MKKGLRLFILLFGVFFCFTVCQSALAAEKKVRFVIPGCG